MRLRLLSERSALQTGSARSSHLDTISERSTRSRYRDEGLRRVAVELAHRAHLVGHDRASVASSGPCRGTAGDQADVGARVVPNLGPELVYNKYNGL